LSSSQQADRINAPPGSSPLLPPKTLEWHYRNPSGSFTRSRCKSAESDGRDRVFEPYALVQAAHQARYRRSPDRALYGSIKARRKAAQPAVLTVARKIARRSYHVLQELEHQAA
jgi:hypothetical protein